MTTMVVEVYEALRKAEGVDDESAKAAARAVLSSEQAATKGDLLGLRLEMAELRGDLRREMAELRGELRGEMTELRGELRGEMTALRGELRADMRGLEIRILQAMNRQLVWFAGIVIGQGAATVALIKLLP